MKWRRTEGGYFSEDGQWFLERGGRMTHGCNAWLIWRAATRSEIEEYGNSFWPVRSLRELSLDDSIVDAHQRLFFDLSIEGGWLSEAKEIVEQLVKESLDITCTANGAKVR